MAKKDNLNRVPPFLPIIWSDWTSSEDIQNMTVTEEGLFLRLLIEQWIYGDFPADAWKLAKRVRVDYRTIKNWLHKYSNLTVCAQCGYGKDTVALPQSSSDSTVTLLRCSCESPVRLLNLKLKKLRDDVNSGRDLGTTKPNLNQTPTLTEPEPLVSLPAGPSEPVKSNASLAKQVGTNIRVSAPYQQQPKPIKKSFDV